MTAAANDSNPVNRECLLCGPTVPPLCILELPEPCHESSRLWPVIPDVTAGGMPPVTVRFDDAGRNVKDAPAPLYDDCYIPCHSSGRPCLVAKRTEDDTNWSFTISMEGPNHYTRSVVDSTVHEQN